MNKPPSIFYYVDRICWEVFLMANNSNKFNCYFKYFEFLNLYSSVWNTNPSIFSNSGVNYICVLRSI